VGCGGRQQAKLSGKGGRDGILGDWGGIYESTRCARMDRLLSFMARALSLACPGSSATRLLIAAVDLGLSPFSVQAGHEVSLCQAWMSMRTTWEKRGVDG